MAKWTGKIGGSRVVLVSLGADMNEKNGRGEKYPFFPELFKLQFTAKSAVLGVFRAFLSCLRVYGPVKGPYELLKHRETLRGHLGVVPLLCRSSYSV